MTAPSGPETSLPPLHISLDCSWAKIPAPLLLARAACSLADLCSASLNRNAVGLMAFSLTDLVKKTLLFLEIGDHACIVIMCDILRLFLQISNERSVLGFKCVS